MTEGETVGWHHRQADMNLSKLQEMVKDWEAWRTAVSDLKESETTEWPNNHTVDASPWRRIDSAHTGVSCNATSQRQVNK